MFTYRKCYDGSNCPSAAQVSLGVLNPTSANQSRALNRSALIRNSKGTIVIPDNTGFKTGVFVTSDVAYTAPRVIGNVVFDKPFRKIPTVHLVIDDFGNNQSWIVHIRNLSNFSFDLVLKNADKPEGKTFAIYWSAQGEVY